MDTSTTNKSIPQNQDLSTGKSDIAEENAPKADIKDISDTDKQNLKSIGQKKHVIKLTVEEILNPGKTTERRAYKLIDIEKYQPSAGGSQNNSLTSSLKAGTVKSIADLVAFVKGFDKEFSPAPEVNNPSPHIGKIGQ